MPKKKFQLWIVWFIVSLFYAYQYILRVLPSILLPDITRKFHLSPDVFGQFSGVYYIGYSLMHLPIGAMLDRQGVRRVLPNAILLTVLGTLTLVYCDWWIFAIIGRLLVGIGSSAAILGVFKVVQTSFPVSKFSRMLSFSVTIGLMGAIYGGGPVHAARTNLGYETVVGGLASIGVILAILTFFLVPEPKAGTSTFSLETFVSDVKAILSTRMVIILCLASGMMVGPLEGFADVWGAQFLKVVYHMDDRMAASLPSLIFLGMCFGSPVLSFIAETSKRYLEVILMSGVIMALCFALLISGLPSISVISVLFVIIGVCCSYQILAIYQISQQVGPNYMGTATAIANMVIMIFGYLFHGTIGAVVGLMAGENIDIHSPAFADPNSLSLGISVIPIAILFSLSGMAWAINLQNHPQSGKRRKKAAY